MPLTFAGYQLTVAHRLLQVRIGALLATQMIAAFKLLDPVDLDASMARWLHVAEPLIQAQRLASIRAAAAYLHNFRLVETGETFTPVLARAAPVEQVRTSLLVTGPVSIKSNMTRMSLGQAVDTAAASVSGAVMRLALDAGRETILETVTADPRAQGWERVTSGSACDFCEMLADRGVVYSEASADFASHDHCGCSASPAYEGEARSVRSYTPTTRTITGADRARVRDWIEAHPRAG